MRLLLDENISWRVAPLLTPHCESLLHVRDLGLDNSPDTDIWRYAKTHGYDIITKDEDYVRLVTMNGFPPRIVAVQNAQVSAAKLAAYLLAHLAQVRQFLDEQSEFGMMVLRMP